MMGTATLSSWKNSFRLCLVKDHGQISMRLLISRSLAIIGFTSAIGSGVWLIQIQAHEVT